MRKIYFIVFIISSFSFYGQKEKTIYGGLSTTSYKGDFSSYLTWNNAVDIGLVLNQNKKVRGEFQLRTGSITAQSLSFSSPIKSYVKTSFFVLNYGLNIKFIDIKDKFSCSFVPGFGVFRFNPKDIDNNNLNDQGNTRSKNESYNSMTIATPLKLNIGYKTDYKVRYNLSLGYINPMTDYLDNISMLADSKNKDNIFFLGFEIGFDFTQKEKVKLKPAPSDI